MHLSSELLLEEGCSTSVLTREAGLLDDGATSYLDYICGGMDLNRTA